MAEGERDTEDVTWRQTKFAITDTGSQDLVYINSELKQAWNRLYAIQNKADILRTTYLEDLAQYKAETLGTTASQEIKKLIHIEEIRKTAKKHGWYLKEHRKGMVDHVLIPTHNIAIAPAFMFFLFILYWTLALEAYGIDFDA